MKKNFLKICVAFVGVVMAGCLDDSKYALDPEGYKNVIEFADASIPSNPFGSVYPVYTNTTEIVPEITFEYPLSYSGPNKNTSDIELTLAVDPIALQEYNQQMADDLHGSPYSLMPANYYSFDDLTVTIPKGETKVNISVTVFPTQFDLTKNFALPIRIVSASSGILSAHFSTALLAVVVKNKYDGKYEIIGGSITRNSATGPDLALGGTYNAGLKLTMETINGNTNGFAPLWKDGSGVGGVAGTRVAINETTNAVTVTATGNATLKNTPATVNSYDPVTKTFTLSFDWGAAPNTRIVSGLQLKYVGPR